MSCLQIILIIIVSFLAGCEGILDEWQFHQPLVACTLIGLIAGQLRIGIVLGGMLQMIALGWANIGAAVAPDVALASVASVIILLKSNLGKAGIGTAVALAVVISLLGLLLTRLVRTLSNKIVGRMDQAARQADWHRIDHLQVEAVCLQGCRIMLPAIILLLIPKVSYEIALRALPVWLTSGLTIGAGMVTAVGFAAIVNMMSSKESWPLFAIGFSLAAISDLSFIALTALAVAGALIYLALDNLHGNSQTPTGGNSDSGDPLGDIIDS